MQDPVPSEPSAPFGPPATGPRTDVTPPDAALAAQAAALQLGNWIGGVPISLGKSYKVVAISGVVAVVALLAAFASAAAGGAGGLVGAILIGIVALVAGAVAATSLVDTIRTSGRAAQVYERGMALPDGRGWYLVPWMTGRITPLGGDPSADGNLQSDPLGWTIGNLGADDHNSMVEPDAGLVALYKHALTQITMYQLDPVLSDLRSGRSVTFGALLLGPDAYRGSQGGGDWSTLSAVWWSSKDGALVAEQHTPNGRLAQPITSATDEVPNLPLVIAVMREMIGTSLR